MTSTNPPQSPTTAAFLVQSVIAFCVALGAMLIALWQMPGDAWVRAFLALGMIFLVSSTFTLAKCVRDRQESNAVVNRVDQARLDKLMAEHDPFRGA
ncbi:YiaA/YiaB family inner membrane protein [Pseudonocardia sp. CA-107938]|uniref:YiaA/YiaB family inner membrane protein n=1 Tax=Pseudonocardia sp. CA-107938 TaxID=3240021 RepID=UPI003D8DD7CA